MVLRSGEGTREAFWAQGQNKSVAAGEEENGITLSNSGGLRKGYLIKGMEKTMQIRLNNYGNS
jgi:hypothetical protein